MIQLNIRIGIPLVDSGVGSTEGLTGFSEESNGPSVTSGDGLFPFSSDVVLFPTSVIIFLIVVVEMVVGRKSFSSLLNGKYPGFIFTV